MMITRGCSWTASNSIWLLTSTRNLAGCSRPLFKSLMNSAAEAPSKTRWSADRVIFMIGRTTISSSTATGLLTIELTASIALWGGLIIA